MIISLDHSLMHTLHSLEEENYMLLPKHRLDLQTYWITTVTNKCKRNEIGTGWNDVEMFLDISIIHFAISV